MSQNGKGDTPRPVSVPPDEFARRWEKALGPKPQEVRKPLNPMYVDMAAILDASEAHHRVREFDRMLHGFRLCADKHPGRGSFTGREIEAALAEVGR